MFNSPQWVFVEPCGCCFFSYSTIIPQNLQDLILLLLHINKRLAFNINRNQLPVDPALNSSAVFSTNSRRVEKGWLLFGCFIKTEDCLIFMLMHRCLDCLLSCCFFFVFFFTPQFVFIVIGLRNKTIRLLNVPYLRRTFRTASWKTVNYNFFLRRRVKTVGGAFCHTNCQHFSKGKLSVRHMVNDH